MSMYRYLLPQGIDEAGLQGHVAGDEETGGETEEGGPQES